MMGTTSAKIGVYVSGPSHALLLADRQAEAGQCYPAWYR